MFCFLCVFHCEFLRHACWHFKYFLCHPTSIIGCNCACFCSITWWIVSIALGNQATVYTLASYNFLCMVIMLNGWWLHGSSPKLTTVSRAFNGYNVCQEARRPASYIWLLRSLQRVLELALTFLSDWRQKWMGQWVFARGGVWSPRGRCCCGVLCSIHLYQQKQEVSFINNHKTSSQSDLLSLRCKQLLTLGFLAPVLFWYDTGSFMPCSPPHSAVLKFHGKPFVVPSMAAAVIRVSPGVTKLSWLGCTPPMTSPILFLFFIYFSPSLSAWDIRVDIRRKDFIHPHRNLMM